MDVSFFSYAILIEAILILLVWIGFLHWRLSKKKKQLLAVSEVEIPEPFEVYLQYINREISETKAHLDKLEEQSPDDLETINMYQYRLKHLDAEQKAMAESKGEVIRFWEIYRSNIEFVYAQEEDEETVEFPVEETAEMPAVEEVKSMADELDHYKNSSASIIEQSDNVIELIQKFADQNDSEELKHMIGLLTSEKEQLQAQLATMESEYSRLMNNAAIEMQSKNVSTSNVTNTNETTNMSVKLTKQNSRISELNDIVGNLSLELEDKKRLVEETEWVSRQLKETEQVVVILEDENNFLKAQIHQLLETE